MKRGVVFAIFGGFLLAQAVDFAVSYGFVRSDTHEAGISCFGGSGFRVLETHALKRVTPPIAKKSALGHTGLQFLAIRKNKPDAIIEAEDIEKSEPVNQEIVIQPIEPAPVAVANQPAQDIKLQSIVAQLAPVTQELEPIQMPESIQEPIYAQVQRPAPMMPDVQQSMIYPQQQMAQPIMQQMIYPQYQQPMMQQPQYQPMIYNQQPHIAAFAMQMQAQAMAMQSQASAMMMQAQQPIIYPQYQQPMMQQPAYQPMQPMMHGQGIGYSMDLQKLTRPEKMQKLMSYLQQISQSGSNDIHRLLLLLDAELDIIENLLANSGGQIVDRLVMERNQSLRQSSALTCAAYDLVIDIATTAEQDGSDSRLYQYFVRKGKKTMQSLSAPQGRKKFLLKMLAVLQEEYEMIESMQRIVMPTR